MKLDEVEETLQRLTSGEIRLPRFTKEEVRASYGDQFGKLWGLILYLESAEDDAGKTTAFKGGAGGAHSKGGGRLGHLREVATCYGSDPADVIGEIHDFLDNGVESKVYIQDENTVLKLHKLNVFDMEDVRDAVAKIVYHNYLFPKDAYVLQDVVRWETNGTDLYYLLLEQPLVEPLTNGKDPKGHDKIAEPSIGHIKKALDACPQKFRVIEVDSSDNAEDTTATTGKSPMGRWIAFNDQYIVSDFKPGRNTFLDKDTGEVRFIDPRVMLNDPKAGFPLISQYGHRDKTGLHRPATDSDLDDMAAQVEEEERFRLETEDKALDLKAIAASVLAE